MGKNLCVADNCRRALLLCIRYASPPVRARAFNKLLIKVMYPGQGSIPKHEVAAQKRTNNNNTLYL